MSELKLWPQCLKTSKCSTECAERPNENHKREEKVLVTQKTQGQLGDSAGKWACSQADLSSIPGTHMVTEI